MGGPGAPVPAGLAPPASGPAGAGGVPGPDDKPKSVTTFAREQAEKGAKGDGGKSGEGVASTRGGEQDKELARRLRELPADQKAGVYAEALKKAQDETKALKDAVDNFQAGRLKQNQEGKLGVDLAVASNNLRDQTRMTQAANQRAYGRNCVEIGGVWIDDQFAKETKTVAVKAQGEAYFRILEKQPRMKDVYRLGNHLVWMTPSGTALVIDANDGKDKLTDEEIDNLFVAAKK
jgi:Ca-activated chloride channel family protein